MFFLLLFSKLFNSFYGLQTRLVQKLFASVVIIPYQLFIFVVIEIASGIATEFAILYSFVTHFYKPLYSCCGEPRRISKENFCVSCQKMNWCNHTNGRLMSKRTNKRPFHSKYKEMLYLIQQNNTPKLIDVITHCLCNDETTM